MYKDRDRDGLKNSVRKIYVYVQIGSFPFHREKWSKSKIENAKPTPEML